MPGEGPQLDPDKLRGLRGLMDSLGAMERLIDAARPVREQAPLMAPSPFDFGIEGVSVVALEVRRQPVTAQPPGAHDELRAEWERLYVGSNAAQEIPVIRGNWRRAQCRVTQLVTLRPLRHTFERVEPEQEEFTIRFVE